MKGWIVEFAELTNFSIHDAPFVDSESIWHLNEHMFLSPTPTPFF